MAKYTILVADDEEGVRELFKEIALEEGFKVLLAKDGIEAVQKARSEIPDVIILDIRMPDMDGMEAFRRIKESLMNVPVIFITAFGTSDLAIEAMKNGAYNYLTKPFDIDEIRIVIRRAIQLRQLTNEVAVLRSGGSNITADQDELHGHSPVMQEIYKSIGRIADNDAAVLLIGENGTGKELIARKIHENSNRKLLPFVLVNCCQEPAILANELKHIPSSECSVFFRNIEKLPTSSQHLLMEILNQKPKWRIMSSSTTDLSQEASSSLFREDLYYLIKVVPIQISPLRDHIEDLEDFALYFMKRFCIRYGKIINGFTAEALKVLQGHHWPGNMDELENAVAHAVIVATGTLITADDLPVSLRETRHPTISSQKKLLHGLSLHAAVKQFEKQLILDALQQAGGSKTKSAELLGISRRSLFNKMKEFQLLKENETEPN
jgi:two-component system, NtrC family, response regulator AtoC